MPEKTHRVVRDPSIPVQYLADYMAASNQVRRSIVQKCRYQTLSRVLQHQIARRTISEHLLGGNPLPGSLPAQAQTIRERLADTDFEISVNQHNGDFVEAFANNCAGFDISGFQLMSPVSFNNPVYNGTVVRFAPSLLTHRTTKANTQKIGAVMYRYSKGKPVAKEIAEWQAAFMYGFLAENPFIEEAKPEASLCIVWCAVSGIQFTTPAKPIYKFNEMKAVCSDIAERWENVPPPSGAKI